ncbi:MAG TPA: transporter substrate-binding domain-containing protein [Victivallales bacterium]|nr:transporter substrate-binding domain-containing protein [Victivallales bacterium]
MMTYRKHIFVLLVFLNFFIISYAATSVYTVAVYDSPPFVNIGKNGNVSGYSIELLKQLTKNINPDIMLKYKVFKDISEFKKTVRDGGANLGIGAIAISSKDENQMDFSHPYYRAKTGILVPKKSVLYSIRNIFISKNVFEWIIVLVVYIIISSHIIWFIERNKSDWMKSGYFKGVALGVWWTITTMSTVGYGDFYPKRSIGKFFGIFVIFSGIALFSMLIALLTSTVTMKQLKYDINGLRDLVDRPVTVIKDAIVANELKEYAVRVVEVKTITSGISLISDERAVAMVDDEPLLKFYLKKNKIYKYDIIPIKSFYQDYAIAFKNGSELRKKYNISLFKFIESGEYQKLNKKWF